MECGVATRNGNFISPSHYIKTHKQDVFKITLKNGFYIKGSSEHKVFTDNDYKRLDELKIKDKVLLKSYENIWPVKEEFESNFIFKQRKTYNYVDDIKIPLTVNKDISRLLGYLVSEGAVILGEVENSIIFSGVKINENAVVKDSVVMADVEIKKNSVVNYSIIDEMVKIGPDLKIGTPKDQNSSITVIPRESVINNM